MKKLFNIILFACLSLTGYAQVYTDTPEAEAARDAFGRFRVSMPTALFDAQLTYDLCPLLFDTITVGTGATITHDATNRNASIAFSSTASGGQVFMQTFEFFRYQPGKSQLVFITFNMLGGTANVDKIVGYSDGSNGIEFLMDDTTPKVRILSDTGTGDETVTRASWNIDPMDGTGPSGDSLDFTKTQILVIDFEALYVGRVRIGWNIDGITHYCHEFLHANLDAEPYFQSASLPIRVGMTCSGTATTSMDYICSSIMSEGGQEDTYGYLFASAGTVTAGNGVDSMALSIQPNTTFNGITNRSKIILESIDVVVTGANPVEWKLCLGQALTGGSTTDVNATYSAMERVTGTLSGSPAIVLMRGYVAATSQQKQSVQKNTTIRLPITLDHAGAVRTLGRLTVLVSGIGGTSATRVILNWREIR